MFTIRAFSTVSRLVQSVRIATAATVILSTPVLAQTVPGHNVEALTQADKTAAIRAVQNTLPSVAILGQKAGPSDTIEVFIQIPGVLNMQSVYVLSDRTSVISGVVVPPISGSYPGGQLELPTGEATVNPRAPRTNMQQMNSILEVDPAASSPVAPAGESPSSTAPTLPETIPSPPVSMTDTAPKTATTAPERASTEGSVRPPKPSPASGVASTASSAATPEPSTSAPKTDTNAEETGVIERLSDISGDHAFGRAVSAMLGADSDISRLKSLEGNPDSQRQGFLEMVRSLPAIVQGESDRKSYVLFDPNCPVCHRYYQQLSAYTTSGQVEVHWIPVVVFPDRRSSITASAALLAERDRGGDALAMLDKLMTVAGYSEQIDQSPGVDRLVPYIDPVVKSTALLTIARPATPLTVFEHKAQGLAIFTGVPEKDYISLIKPS